MDNEKTILVAYINVGNLDEEDIPQYLNEYGQLLNTNNLNTFLIIVPIFGGQNRVECINPKYITEKGLIEENEKRMKDLNNYIKNLTNDVHEKKED